MTYQQSLSWLFEQFPAYHLQGISAYKPNLDNIISLAESFGNPHQNLRFIHVAGTNGKGSTSNFLASILTENGERVGLYTSPHIFDFRERIRVNGECISEQAVVDFCLRIQQNKLVVAPSFFEITWLMALLHFQQEKCSIVVVETGLGGRLDATNTITPILSIITNISLDHTAILGNTRIEIAREKAGIIKPNVPVVIGEKDDETLPVFETTANYNHSQLTITSQNNISFPSEIIGYQRQNFATVCAAIEVLNRNGFTISQQTIQSGITHLANNTGFWGRLQLVSNQPLTIVDCAHNPAGIAETLKTVRELPHKRLHILYGTSSDKEIDAIRSLFPTDASYYFTAFSNPRSASLNQIQEWFVDFEAEKQFFSTPSEALTVAKEACNQDDILLIMGSFFLLSDFFEEFST